MPPLEIRDTKSDEPRYSTVMILILAGFPMVKPVSIARKEKRIWKMTRGTAMCVWIGQELAEMTMKPKMCTPLPGESTQGC